MVDAVNCRYAQHNSMPSVRLISAFFFQFRSYPLSVFIFCCYTPAHEILYRKIFLPSVPAGFEVRATEIGIEGAGDFLSDEFLRCIRAKIDLVVRSVAENLGAVIVWSDVDIKVFNLSPSALAAELESSACEILFQRESSRIGDVNTGFFICRCTPAMGTFFRAVRAELESHPEENEQMAVNGLLLKSQSGIPGADDEECERPLISWGYLPSTFYARTQCWPPPTNLSLYHANCTNGPDGIGQKIRQFQEIEWIQRHGRPARIWSVFRRVPGKLGEILKKINR